MVDYAEVGRLTLYHLGLVGAGVALSAAVALPLGIAVTRERWRKHASKVQALAGMLQTIPSLAVVAFAVTLLGLGWRAAVVALVLYGFLPMLHNTVTGLEGVAPDLREAAKGLGLTPRQVLWRVEWPVAMPFVLAGLRTSIVLTIGTAALAAEIGAPCLGNLIFSGVATNSIDLILAGAIPTALLAIGADFGMGAAEKKLIPRGLLA